MKILLVAFDYRPKLGGVATCSFELASALANMKDIEVQVLAPKFPGDQDFDNNHNFHTKRIELSKTAIKAVLPLAFKIRKAVEDYRPELIINMLWMPEGLSSYIFSKFLNHNNIPYYVFRPWC